MFPVHSIKSLWKTWVNHTGRTVGELNAPYQRQEEKDRESAAKADLVLSDIWAVTRAGITWVQHARVTIWCRFAFL